MQFRWVRVGLAALVSGILAGSAQAATINWGAATPVSGPSDVSTDGTRVDAINFGTSTIAPNGVTFVPVVTQANTTTGLGGNQASDDGSATAPIVVTIDNVRYMAGNSSFAGDYGTLLNYLGYQNNGGSAEPSTVFLNGLTVNRQYEVEMWASQEGNNNANNNNAQITGGPTLWGGWNASTSQPQVGKPGEYAVGTFTADATSQSFTFSSATSNPIVDAIQLRAVPEPCGAGLLALVGSAALLRRRGACRSA